ncbi:MAG: transcriptional regulator [Burkholderiales bacterium]|jgi:putative transcriptional regulator|nr:transcriptional regulator [Burkholderiales bacterium]
MSNKILTKIHKSVTSAYKKGIVDLTTMQKFDKLCMIDIHPMLPAEILNIRKNIAKVTQPDFAKLLGISLSTVAKWETGNKHPQGTSLKLLSLIERKGIDFYLKTFAI